jgi:hypothetical protein
MVGLVVGEVVPDAVVGFADGFKVGFVVGRNVVPATGDGLVTIIKPPWPLRDTILTLMLVSLILPAAPSPPLPSSRMEVIR